MARGPNVSYKRQVLVDRQIAAIAQEEKYAIIHEGYANITVFGLGAAETINVYKVHVNQDGTNTVEALTNSDGPVSLTQAQPDRRISGPLLITIDKPLTVSPVTIVVNQA